MRQHPENYWICLKQSNVYNIQIFGSRRIFFEVFCISTIDNNRQHIWSHPLKGLSREKTALPPRRIKEYLFVEAIDRMKFGKRKKETTLFFKLDFQHKTNYFLIMKQIIFFILFFFILSLPISILAVEVAPRISDREIIEKLAGLEVGCPKS